MTHATYAERSPTGDGRGNVVARPMPPLWLVLHTSEGGEGLDSAEALCRFIASPASGGNVASYHYVFDTDCVRPIVRDDFRAHGASGGNERGLHACFPGTTRQTRDDWLDTVSSAYIDRAAEWIADKSLEHGIPVGRLTPADLVAGQAGVCDHFDVTRAFGFTDHTDVGPGFPWDVLFARVADLIAPSPPPIEFPTILKERVVLGIARRDSSGAIEITENFMRRRELTDTAATLAIAMANAAGTPFIDKRTAKPVAKLEDVSTAVGVPELFGPVVTRETDL